MSLVSPAEYRYFYLKLCVCCLSLWKWVRIRVWEWIRYEVTHMEILIPLLTIFRTLTTLFKIISKPDLVNFASRIVNLIWFPSSETIIQTICCFVCLFPCLFVSALLNSIDDLRRITWMSSANQILMIITPLWLLCYQCKDCSYRITSTIWQSYHMTVLDHNTANPLRKGRTKVGRGRPWRSRMVSENILSWCHIRITWLYCDVKVLTSLSCFVIHSFPLIVLVVSEISELLNDGNVVLY